MCRKVIETRKNMRIKDHSPHTERIRGNTPLKDKGYCNHCRRYGHNEANCWAIHQNIHPKRNKKARKTPLREIASQEVLQGNPPLGGNQLPEKGKLDTK